jgi:hypothetical protein
MSSVPKRDLPEWLRVISIFVLTFALMAVLSGLAGFKIERVDDPVEAAKVLNQPY